MGSSNVLWNFFDHLIYAFRDFDSRNDNDKQTEENTDKPKEEEAGSKEEQCKTITGTRSNLKGLCVIYKPLAVRSARHSAPGAQAAFDLSHNPTHLLPEVLGGTKGQSDGLSFLAKPHAHFKAKISVLHGYGCVHGSEGTAVDWSLI